MTEAAQMNWPAFYSVALFVVGIITFAVFTIVVARWAGRLERDLADERLVLVRTQQALDQVMRERDLAQIQVKELRAKLNRVKEAMEG